MGKDKKAILISCFDWYHDRLKYIEKYLEKRGYLVKILMSDFSHIEKSYSKKYKFLKQIQYVHVPQYNRNISVKRLISHKYFASEVASIIKKEKPDLIYCLIPPNSLVNEIAVLKSTIGFKLIFDVIDLWPESFPWGNASIFPFVIWKRLRNVSLDAADMVVLECGYYQRILKQVVPLEKCRVLYLIKSALISESCHLDSKTLKLCYLGSINHLIDIDTICTVITELKKNFPVVVKIIGAGKKEKEFIKRLEELKISVEFYGKIYDDTKMQKIFSDCHFGINIYKPSVNIGLTIKSVDYFRMGIPILNSIGGDTAELVRMFGIGINLEDLCEHKVQEFVVEAVNKRKIVKDVFEQFFDKEQVENRLVFLDEIIK